MTNSLVFYDGQYFFHVSNYYRFNHQRLARFNLNGIHRFIHSSLEQLSCSAKGENIRDAVRDVYKLRGIELSTAGKAIPKIFCAFLADCHLHKVCTCYCTGWRLEC